MGQFSFITSDTGRSIPVVGYSKGPTKVYLLRPGDSPVMEDAYAGYGEFGGIDSFEWLAQINAPHLQIDVSDWTIQQRRELGIFLHMDKVYRDSSNQLWAVCTSDYAFFEKYGVRVADGHYGVPVQPGAKTPNQLIASGEWESLTPTSLGMVQYHIKLVEHPADYFSVQQSKDCPYQGMPDPEGDVA